MPWHPKPRRGQGGQPQTPCPKPAPCPPSPAPGKPTGPEPPRTPPPSSPPRAATGAPRPGEGGGPPTSHPPPLTGPPGAARTQPLLPRGHCPPPAWHEQVPFLSWCQRRAELAPWCEPPKKQRCPWPTPLPVSWGGFVPFGVSFSFEQMPRAAGLVVGVFNGCRGSLGLEGPSPPINITPQTSPSPASGRSPSYYFFFLYLYIR